MAALFAIPASLGGFPSISCRSPRGCVEPTLLHLDRGTVPTEMLSLRERLEAVEKEALEHALRTARGNRAKAARLLSTTERIFNYRVRKYGIDWRKYRNDADEI